MSDNEIQVPATIAEKVAKVGSVYNHALEQTRLWFQVNHRGNMVERYAHNLPVLTKARNGVSEDFDTITTGIYEGKNGNEVPDGR
jgi:hypothetical protein